MIVIIFTGGTISMRVDPSTGGAVPALRGAQLLANVPGIEQVAPLEIDEWATMAASHFTVEHLWSIGRAFYRILLAATSLAWSSRRERIRLRRWPTSPLARSRRANQSCSRARCARQRIWVGPAGQLARFGPGSREPAVTRSGRAGRIRQPHLFRS